MDLFLKGYNLIHVFGYIITQLFIVAFKPIDLLIIDFGCVLSILLKLFNFFTLLFLFVFQIVHMIKQTALGSLAFSKQVFKFSNLVLMLIWSGLELGNAFLEFVDDVMVLPDLIIFVEQFLFHFCFFIILLLFFEVVDIPLQLLILCC